MPARRSIAEDAQRVLAALTPAWQRADEIERVLGWPPQDTSRRVRAAVRHLTMHGWSVASSEHGYRRAAAPEDLDPTIADLDHRIGALVARRDRLAETRRSLATA